MSNREFVLVNGVTIMMFTAAIAALHWGPWVGLGAGAVFWGWSWWVNRRYPPGR